MFFAHHVCCYNNSESFVLFTVTGEYYHGWGWGKRGNTAVCLQGSVLRLNSVSSWEWGPLGLRVLSWLLGGVPGRWWQALSEVSGCFALWARSGKKESHGRLVLSLWEPRGPYNCLRWYERSPSLRPGRLTDLFRLEEEPKSRCQLNPISKARWELSCLSWCRRDADNYNPRTRTLQTMPAWTDENQGQIRPPPYPDVLTISSQVP